MTGLRRILFAAAEAAVRRLASGEARAAARLHDVADWFGVRARQPHPPARRDDDLQWPGAP